MAKLEEMYDDLLKNESDAITPSRMSSYEYDDDSEEFMTSKEIVKQKEARKEHFGVSPAGYVDIEEDVHFKSYRKRHEHKYTESEMAKIRESCMMTIVHDYGEHDIYHMSDEERAENDMLSELSMKLGGLKRTYRKVDQYIEAMRIVMQAWELLEKNGNYIHTPDEFYTLVSEGKIVSNRIIMPKLKKMDTYNLDMIIKYISNPELDASTLLPEKKPKEDSFYDFLEEEEDPRYNEFYQEYMDSHQSINEDEEIDEYELHQKADEYAKKKLEEIEFTRLISPDEAQYLYDHIDNPESIEVKSIPRKFIKGYDRRDFSSKKKLNKNERAIAEDLHDIMNKIQMNPENRPDDGYTRSYMVTHSMFDLDKPMKDFWEDLRFDGSWADDTAVYLYDLVVREELLKQHPAKERYLTYADKELQQFFKTLEDNGINTIDLRRKMELNTEGSITTRAEEKATKKENKKTEAAIIQRISKLNDNDKFKKLVGKAEKALNKYYEG